MLLSRWYLLEFDTKEDELSTVESLKNESIVEWAEPNGVMHIADTMPNDTAFAPRQWALRNTGQASGGVTGADIEATKAWDISTGNSSVKVAVPATGFPFTTELKTRSDFPHPAQ